MDQKQQPTEKRNPDQQKIPGQQPQRTPNQKPQHEQERERKES